MLSQDSAQYLLNLLKGVSVKADETFDSVTAELGKVLNELRSVAGVPQAPQEPVAPVVSESGAEAVAPVETVAPVNPDETPNPSPENTPAEG